MRLPPIRRSRRLATTRERSLPHRTCVGCGRRVAKAELVRFTEVGGVLSEGATTGGRGAYTCRDAACFERASAGGAFARSLRRAVSVEPQLARLYTEVSHG
jgi:uncharacterized protein